MCEQRFFKCSRCGNLIGLIDNAGGPLSCCGELMTELIPNVVEAATEKHIPEITVDGSVVNVKIGSVAHPMTEEHHIKFIYLETESGGQRKCLKVGAEAVAKFSVLEDKPLKVYAYCNLHGLWKADISNDCKCKGTDMENEVLEDMACSAEFSEGCK